MKKIKYAILSCILLGLIVLPSNVLGVDCNIFKNETSCVAYQNGVCSWKNQTCVETKTNSSGNQNKDNCSIYKNEVACMSDDICSWENNTCVENLSKPPSLAETCERLSSKKTCEDSGICEWNTQTNTCGIKTVTNPSVLCPSIKGEDECNSQPNQSCYWDGTNGRCKVTPAGGVPVIPSDPDDNETELYEKTSCGPVGDIPAGLPKFTRNLVNLLKVLVPVILIIMGMIDFLRAVISNDEKNMKASQSRFIRRIIAAILVFFVVVIVQFVFGMIQSEDNVLSCLNCFLSSESGCVASSTNKEKKKSCSDYKSEGICPTVDEKGSLCVWKSNRCQSNGVAKYCKDYTGDECPSSDHFGNLCKIFTRSDQSKTCVWAGTGKHCGDYSATECPVGETDAYGYVCAKGTEGGRPVCVSDHRANVSE